MSWSKQASLWKPLWIEKENRICVHAPITHQENAFQVILRDDLLPPEDLIFPHFFPLCKHIFKKNQKSFLEGKCSLLQNMNERHLDLKVHIVFLKGYIAVSSAAWQFSGLKSFLGDKSTIDDEEAEV